MYKSENFIHDFYSQCIITLAEIQCLSYEIIFVNDGSPDNSLNEVLKLREKDKNIIVIDLSRNFGHHNAIMAGLTYSSGELVFLIDCDMEVPPTTLSKFYKTMERNIDCDVVFGIQDKRKGFFIERILGSIFYKLFNSLTDIKVHSNSLAERLMTKRFVDEVVKMGDKNIFLAGMMQWAGFKQIPLTIKKGLREGKSTYTFRKRLLLSLQAITSFSSYPLVLLFKTGIFIASLSILTGGYFIVKKLFYPNEILSGFTFVIVVLLFSLGIIVSSLGLIGIYIDKLFNQVKNRQTFIVRNIYKSI